MEVDKLLECQELFLLTGIRLFSILINTFQELWSCVIFHSSNTAMDSRRTARRLITEYIINSETSKFTTTF
jgi:hypothetical protein